MLHWKRLKCVGVILLFFFTLRAGDVPSVKITSVVIDAGHGGDDPGALGLVAAEKDLTLSIALKAGSMIADSLKDVKVMYTRTTDVFVPLDERADLANKNHADLFISIHVNSNPNKGASGFETYVMGIHTSEKNMEVAMKENAVITYEKDYQTKYEGYDPHSAESFIIFSLVQNIYLEQSLNFATVLQESFKEVTGKADRGVKQAGFLVLWKSSMPSVLIEAGFISNKNEERWLITEKAQQQIAYAIYRAFAMYKKSIEKKQVVEKTGPLARTDSSGENLAGVSFRIQILSSARPVSLQAPDFNKLKNIKEDLNLQEFYAGKIYKYTVGKYSEYADAQSMLKKIRQYYPDAFIVAEESGELVPLQKAMKKK